MLRTLNNDSDKVNYLILQQTSMQCISTIHQNLTPKKEIRKVKTKFCLKQDYLDPFPQKWRDIAQLILD